jgi:hypothetical protein
VLEAARLVDSTIHEWDRTADMNSLATALMLLLGIGHFKHADAGADDDAGRAVGLLEGLPARDGPQWFSLACARATLAAAAGRGGSGPSAAEAPGQADRAMDDLRRAAAMGFRSPAAFRYEPALRPLRGRGDFRELMRDLDFPADPFAR